MKKTLCIILSLLFCFMLFGCDAKTIDFSEELKSEEAAKKTATAHFPLTLSVSYEFSVDTTLFRIDEEGNFDGNYYHSKFSESGEGYTYTVYRSTFKGEFDNFEMVNDYTIKMHCYNLKAEEEIGVEEIDAVAGIRYINALPEGFTDNKATFILYTPETPLLDAPNEILGHIPYGTSGTLGVYVLVNEDASIILTSKNPQTDYYY